MRVGDVEAYGTEHTLAEIEELLRLRGGESVTITHHDGSESRSVGSVQVAAGTYKAGPLHALLAGLLDAWRRGDDDAGEYAEGLMRLLGVNWEHRA